MVLFKRILLALIITMGVSTPAFAALGSGNGGTGTLGVYLASPPTLANGQAAPLQLDSVGRLVVSPFSLIFGSPLQTYSSTGVGADTAFPATVVTTGTSLGVLPTGGSSVQLHVPIGASVSGYVAVAAAATAAAATALSRTYNNVSTNTNVMDVGVSLNGMQFFVTNYTSGTATTYTSGAPTFRFI